MFPLYLTIEPRSGAVQLVLTGPSTGPSLKAMLPLPSEARAVPMLLEALCLWHRAPLRAVLDADAADVRHHPERWALLAGDLPLLELSVEWARRRVPRRNERARFLEEMGSHRSARRLLGSTVTGLL